MVRGNRKNKNPAPLLNTHIDTEITEDPASSSLSPLQIVNNSDVGPQASKNRKTCRRLGIIPYIGESVKNNTEFLRGLARSKSLAHRKQLISTASVEQLLAIVEIALNILRSRLPLRSRQRRRLSSSANDIRALSRVRSARSAQRILLASERQAAVDQQHGRGAPLAIAGLLSSVLLPYLLRSSSE